MFYEAKIQVTCPERSQHVQGNEFPFTLLIFLVEDANEYVIKQ